MCHIILSIQEDIAEVQEQMEFFYLMSQAYLCFTSANHPLEHSFSLSFFLFFIICLTLWLHLRGWNSLSFCNQNQQVLNIFSCNLKDSVVIPTMHLLSHGAFLLLTMRMLFCSSKRIMDFLKQASAFFLFQTYF